MIFRCGIAAALLALSSPVAAQSAGPDRPITVQMDGIPTGTLVTMLMRDVMRVPFVIEPEVLADRRPTSVRLVIPRNRVPERIVAYLRQSGFSVVLNGGTVFVGRAGTGGAPAFGEGATFNIADPAMPTGSPLGQPVARTMADVGLPGEPSGQVDAAALIDEPELLLVYRPAHRSPQFLSGVIAPLFPEVVLGARADAQADSASQSINGELAPDLLAVTGSQADLDRLRSLLVVLDRPRPLVAVQAVVMQVSTEQSRGSALSLLASAAGDRVGAGSFADAVPGAQFIRLSTGALSAVLSATREDSRFHVVASPNLSALSGSLATINAGAQVPTLGAVTVTDGGSVQSIVYRDSGITLQVRPTVRGNQIELDVRQERSNFIPTVTGVDGSPTLQTSSVTAQAILSDGESIALAGLTETRDGNRRSGLLGGLLGVRSREEAESELVIVLQARIVPGDATLQGEFFDLNPTATEVQEDA